MSELGPFESLLGGLRSALPTGPGSVFVASSAGAVYAGAVGPPFTIHSPATPLSPYGELKLAQERLASEILGSVTRVIIGRISNLYRPGQNLEKLQGLVSHLARASITRQPTNIFVPLDTTRDYIFNGDAADIILRLTADPTSPPAANGHHAYRYPTSDCASDSLRVDTHIIASGRGTTIGQLIRTMNEVTKRKVPVALGMHSSAAAQATDLRLVPTVAPMPLTPLPVGIKAVHIDLLSRVQLASIAG